MSAGRSSEPRLKLSRIDAATWSALALEHLVSVCQTPQWLSFLRMSQAAEPVVAEVMAGGKPVGAFVGGIMRRAGLRILGSPLRGWTSSYMGFAWRRDAIELMPDYRAAIQALKQFAFRELGCAHLELLDRRAELADYTSLGFTGRNLSSYEIDLSRAAEELFAAMDPACRRCIRRFDKLGCIVEEATDGHAFAAEYYAHLSDVFDRQGLAPPYPLHRVEQLVDALAPDGLVLLLRALDATGRCIGASIYPGYGESMYFWGGASHREHRHNRPNEAMMWAAMRHWQSRGVQRFDMGGGGAYKRKYGDTPIAVPWMRCSRNAALAALRTGAEHVVHLKRSLRR